MKTITNERKQEVEEIFNDLENEIEFSIKSLEIEWCTKFDFENYVEVSFNLQSSFLSKDVMVLDFINIKNLMNKLYDLNEERIYPYSIKIDNMIRIKFLIL